MINSQNYPIDNLPTLFQNAVYDIFNQVQAPLPMIMSTLLAAASLAVQDKIDIQTGEDTVSPVSLNLFVVADSGERKSVVFRTVFKPFLEFDEAQLKQCTQDTEQYHRAMVSWKIIKTTLEKKVEADVKRGRDTTDSIQELDKHLASEPKKPTARLRIIQDCTTDALIQFLAENGGSAGLVSDEGGMIFKSRVSSNLAPLNSIWSGDGYKTDRLDPSRSYALSRNARLTTLIMVQPKTFQAFLNDKGELSRDNGYLARALICYPLSTQGMRFIQLTGTSLPKNGLRGFQDSIKAALESRDRRTLFLGPEASTIWVNFYNQVELSLQPSGFLHACRDSGSKAAEMAYRLAAIFHYMTGDTNCQISSWSMLSATGIMRYYLNEFVRLFVPPPQPDPKQAAAVELFNWLLQEQLKSHPPQPVEKRKILTHGPYKFRNRPARDDALHLLRNWEWILDQKYNNRSYIQVMVQQPQAIPV
jgi:hypothetical protein